MEIFSTISQTINYKNIYYSIVHLQSTNASFNQELLVDVLSTIQFECAGISFVVLSNVEPQSDKSFEQLMKVIISLISMKWKIRLSK